MRPYSSNGSRVELVRAPRQANPLTTKTRKENFTTETQRHREENSFLCLIPPTLTQQRKVVVVVFTTRA